ncbi:alpha/beta hydrolase [Herbaspirillum sp. RTI4]|uniref:alpha/beta hydrolase n=1 Tax=Herbaspirillum sp. RTI4 TaxID=3048640 RepID=UPI002AB5BD46|nr:alpha/beta hydrolase [Herbaspirillum sp. RTI4]MDY7577522.1 alpha/beta hydrolase [Herbaspirillum sp. RTI4]MEA9980997.1 alpha/beta hydrolase [Herbaspirillum sp. RTI4]
MTSFPVSILSESSVSDQWMFSETPPGPASYFVEDFGTYQLEGRVLFSQDQCWPSVLTIHGARSDYTKLNVLMYGLQKQGISTLGFNLSGHSAASNVALSQTSLRNNLKESDRFFGRLKDGSCTVMGHSLGGALALKLAAAHPERIDKLVLFCPAVYGDLAYGPLFGGAFKRAISVPNGFLRTDAFEFLRQFKGKLMLVIGQYDGLRSTDYGGVDGTSAGVVLIDGVKQYSAIPREVIDCIKAAIPAPHLEVLTLPDCDHGISSWLRANPIAADRLTQKVAAFIRS